MISTQISVPSQPGGWRGQERTGCWEMERSQLCDQKWWNFVVTAVYKAVHGWSPFTREDSKCGELMWNICRAGWSVFTFCSALRSAEMRPPASQDSPCNSYLASQLSSRTGLTNTARSLLMSEQDRLWIIAWLYDSKYHIIKLHLPSWPTDTVKLTGLRCSDGGNPTILLLSFGGEYSESILPQTFAGIIVVSPVFTEWEEVSQIFTERFIPNKTS